jgi:DNA primase
VAQHKLRYSEFWDAINVDAFEEAIGFNPEYQRGDNDVGFCLWPENHSHGDTTGKFAIHREARIYNCYVCGGGTFLSLAMELRNLDIDEATEWLYQFTEADMRTDSEFVDQFLESFVDMQKRVKTLPYFNERVLDRFSDTITEAHEWDPDEGDYVPYFSRRAIDPHIAESRGVRFSWEVTRPSPKKGKFADHPDYVGPGLIFPHYWQDRLVGWQTRWLEEERPEWIPKYTMTTDFPKENTIYGWREATWHREHQGMVAVVESAPSVLALETYGWASVATFGSNVNEAQLRLLRRFPKVLLCPDNDTAGIKWKDSLTEYLKRYTRVWHLPPYTAKEGADAGDAASNNALEALEDQMTEVGVL